MPSVLTNNVILDKEHACFASTAAITAGNERYPPSRNSQPSTNVAKDFYKHANVGRQASSMYYPGDFGLPIDGGEGSAWAIPSGSTTPFDPYTSLQTHGPAFQMRQMLPDEKYPPPIPASGLANPGNAGGGAPLSLNPQLLMMNNTFRPGDDALYSKVSKSGGNSISKVHYFQNWPKFWAKVKNREKTLLTRSLRNPQRHGI